MGDRLLAKIIMPYIVGAFACFAWIGGARVFGFPAPWASIIGVACFAAFAIAMAARHRALVAGYIEQSRDEIEETLRHSITHHPLPLCLVGSEGTIAMTNAPFRETFPEAKLLKTLASDLVGEARLADLRCGRQPETLSVGGRDFRLLANFVGQGEGAMLYFLDDTEFRELRKRYESEKLCYCYVAVDNYEDSLQASPDGTRSIRAAAIEALVRQFADDVEGSLLRYRVASYLVVFARKHYARLAEGKFAVLDAARKLETDADFPTSLSIGIGLGDNPVEGKAFADYALDLARGRGGDQAVVKGAKTVEYFGGTVQLIENRNKGKSRMMSHAIRQLIEESSDVVVMGHKYADIDSFGAACAVSRMAAAHGKEAAVVLTDYNHSLSDVYAMAVESGNYRFVTGEEALRILRDGTLLVVVDTHVPEMADEPRLLGKTKRLIVIDHHRKQESVIEGATILYMEPNASSSSELVTEILQFDDNVRKLDKFDAEMLLGGIFIDTNSFSVKTGSRTFEAAAYLRLNGAETTNVRAWLQSDMEDFRQRASITANASFSPSGIAISRSDGKHDNAQVIAAQAADELLGIKGIRASFVVGATKREVVISARSLGDLNVQPIMERFGGGGHLTMAAAQVAGADVDGVIKKLKRYIKEAEGETK